MPAAAADAAAATAAAMLGRDRADACSGPQRPPDEADSDEAVTVATLVPPSPPPNLLVGKLVLVSFG